MMEYCKMNQVNRLDIYIEKMERYYFKATILNKWATNNETYE